MVTRFVEARSLTSDDFRDGTMLSRLTGVLRRLHDAREHLVGEMLSFCPFQTVRTYASTARQIGAQIPEGIDDLLEHARQMSREMSAFHPTLCHNDLLPANVMDDGNRLWLIDWEYAGIGNPVFDLASISANCRFDADQEAELVRAYSGQDAAEILRQIRILKAVSLLREALWAVIQTVKSEVDFDYAKYAVDNFNAYRSAVRKPDR